MRKLNEDEIFLAKKVRLLPTSEQEIQFWKSAGVARWAYNFFLSENQMVYECTGKHVGKYEVLKIINRVLKPNTHKWLTDVGCNVIKQAVSDAEEVLIRYFKGKSGYPKYKTKHKSVPKFYVNYETLHKVCGGFYGEKLGNVKTSEPLPKMPKGMKYCNPRISYDGKYWYLSVGYIKKKEQVTLTNNVYGIDLGIKELAVVADKTGDIQQIYPNINKTVKIKKLEQKLKREQRKYARKYLTNKYNDKDIANCKNLKKQKAKIALIFRKLYNIRNNYIHQITTKIVKTKPSIVVMESLNIASLIKNKHLAKSILDQKWYDFKEKMQYKCNMYGIELVFVPRFYPSSKTCSCCGNVKKDLKLSDRTYRCEKCGLIIDRDLNAAINLANYNS